MDFQVNSQLIFLHPFPAEQAVQDDDSQTNQRHLQEAQLSSSVCTEHARSQNVIIAVRTHCPLFLQLPR